MDARLLLLGLLRSQAMHGYQLNELIESHLGAGVHLTRPTAYRLLNKMTEDGWITYREEQEGNYPARRVYAMSPDGEAAFQQLLRESLAQFEPMDFGDNVGLLFLHALPPAEALSLLQERRAKVEAALGEAACIQDHHQGYELMGLHQTRHLSAEMEWLDEVIERLAAGSLDHPEASPDGSHATEGRPARATRR